MGMGNGIPPFMLPFIPDKLPEQIALFVKQQSDMLQQLIEIRQALAGLSPRKESDPVWQQIPTVDSAGTRSPNMVYATSQKMHVYGIVIAGLVTANHSLMVGQNRTVFSANVTAGTPYHLILEEKTKIVIARGLEVSCLLSAVGADAVYMIGLPQ